MKNNTECISCAKGSYCPGTGIEYTCSNQSYSILENASSCQTCLDGEYFIKNTEPCIKCEKGYYCQDGKKNHCETSYFSNMTNMSTCMKCDNGNFVTADNDACLKCSPGYFCIDGAKIQCPPYTFSNNDFSSECNFCTMGSFIHENSSKCEKCGIGYACPPISFLNNKSVGGYLRQKCSHGFTANTDNMTSCNQCSIQEYIDKNKSKCEVCPPGYFCKDFEKMVCPPSTYNPNSGQSVCLQCTDGYMVMNESQACSKCLAGYYCLKGYGYACPRATFNPLMGSMECFACTLGTYSGINDTQRTRPCDACPENHFCVNPITIERCPENTITPQGSTSVVNCECESSYECSFRKEMAVEMTLTEYMNNGENLTTFIENLNYNPQFLQFMRESISSILQIKSEQIVLNGISLENGEIV